MLCEGHSWSTRSHYSQLVWFRSLREIERHHRTSAKSDLTRRNFSGQPITMPSTANAVLRLLLIYPCCKLKSGYQITPKTYQIWSNIHRQICLIVATMNSEKMWSDNAIVCRCARWSMPRLVANSISYYPCIKLHVVRSTVPRRNRGQWERDPLPHYL